jgi:hypothetical protein
MAIRKQRRVERGTGRTEGQRGYTKVCIGTITHRELGMIVGSVTTDGKSDRRGCAAHDGVAGWRLLSDGAGDAEVEPEPLAT